MSRLFLLVSALSLLLFASCGGGGGAGGGTGPFVIVRVESPTQDPINIVVGQVVSFVLAGYDANNVRGTITADTWSVIVNPGVGSISPSGQFTALSTGTAKIRATWPNSPTPTDLTITIVPAGLARVAGTVRKDVTNAAIGGVTLIFYNASNVEVGRAITLSNGTFLAQVPTTAVRFNFDTASLSGYLIQWRYRTLVFQAGSGIPNCHATIVAPALVAGQTSTMADTVKLIDAGTPPPFPNGCS